MADNPIDTWAGLRRLTAARIGLARTGASLATGPLLDFKFAHARARDAVHDPLDQARLTAELAGFGLPVRTVASAAQDRQTYLMRPDSAAAWRGMPKRPWRKRQIDMTS